MVEAKVTTWRPARSRSAAWMAVAAGLVLLVVGYGGLSAADYEPEQVSYLVSGGLGSLLLLGIGATLLLTSDLSDQHRKLVELAAATGSEPVADTRKVGGGLALLVAWAVSGALLYAGWDQAAAAADTDRDGATQGVPLAVGALLLTAAAGSVATIALRRRVEVEKSQLLPALAIGLAPPAASVHAPAPTPGSGLVTGSGLTRYHRPACPTLVGIATAPLPARPDPALRACQICDAPDRTDTP